MSTSALPPPASSRRPHPFASLNGMAASNALFRIVREQLHGSGASVDFDEIRITVSEFRDRHNRSWILERLVAHQSTPRDLLLNSRRRRDSRAFSYSQCSVHSVRAIQ